MPRWEPEQTVTLSFLDRLIDLDPKAAADQPPSRARSIRQLKASLRRDLEWLLNSRRRPDAAGSEFRELEKSLFNYGLEDVTAMSWVSLQGSRVVDEDDRAGGARLSNPASAASRWSRSILLRAPSMCCDSRSKACSKWIRPPS